MTKKENQINKKQSGAVIVHAFGSRQPRLHRRVLPHNLADAPLICRTILLEEVVGISLRGRLGVWVIEQILDAKKDLLDGDCGSPRFLLVQN